MIDVKWDMSLKFLQRSLYLTQNDGFRVVVKGHTAALISRSRMLSLTIMLKDDSKVALLEMSTVDTERAKILSYLKFIGTSMSFENEISSGRLVIAGSEEDMRWIVNGLTNGVEVTDRPRGTLPEKPHHGQSHTDDDGKEWTYNRNMEQWVSWPPHDVEL